MSTRLALTRTERFLLNEVDSCPDKVASVSALRASARHLTITGFDRVVRRLESRSLLGRNGSQLALTFGGSRALTA